MSIQDIWKSAIMNFWNKWKDQPAWKEEEIPELLVDYTDENGFYNKDTGQIQIQRFILSDPESWGREEKYLINKIPTKAKVLELGCGTGRFGVYLKTKNCQYTGIDIDKDMVAICKERGLETYQMDVLNLKFPEKSFDVILIMNNFLADILLEVKSVANYLQTLLPLLTDNGIIIGSSYYYTSAYKDYSYIQKNKEKFKFKMKWQGKESDLTPAWRLQLPDFNDIVSATKLNLLDQVEISGANYELVKWGFILGKSDKMPSMGNTLYVDWLPVRITYTPTYNKKGEFFKFF